MRTAEIINDDNGQFVRIPDDFRFAGTEVGINKVGDVVMLFPVEKCWEVFAASLDRFSSDFMEERDQGGAPERREPL